MSTKKSIILIIILAVLGSFVNFYCSNLIFSDISNMFYGVHDYNFVASIPFFLIAVEFILLILWILRVNKKPEYRFSIRKTFLINFWVLSTIGILTSLVSGAMIYKSFVDPYPFPYAILICLIVHVIVLWISTVFWIKNSEKIENENIIVVKKKVTFGYSFYSVVLFLTLYLALNRFGAILWCPTFIHLRTLYMTWPFYVGLFIPMAQMVHTFLYTFGDLKINPKGGVIYAWILLAVTLLSNIATIVIGYFNTTFISAISPMLALERLGTLPADVIVIFAVMLIYSVVSLRYSYKMLRKTNK